MESKFDNVRFFLTETPLYDQVYFSSKGILELEFFTETIDVYCPKCDQLSVFQRKYSRPQVIYKGLKNWRPANSFDDYQSKSTSKIQITHYHRLFRNFTEYTPKNIFSGERIIPFEFLCSRDDSHQMIIVVSINENNAMKIGKFPSLADIQKFGTEKYRKILKNKYSEFTRAIGLAANGVGIGAFVYLRRIFEIFVEEAHIKASEAEPDWDNDSFVSSRMDEKIRFLRNYLPDFLVANRKIYGILSKGIHELSEEECLSFYPTLKISIEIILDEKLAEEIRIKKMGEVVKDIQKIQTKLSHNETNNN
jgi:hypothetical protein